MKSLYGFISYRIRKCLDSVGVDKDTFKILTKSISEQLLTDGYRKEIVLTRQVYSCIIKCNDDVATFAGATPSNKCHNREIVSHSLKAWVVYYVTWNLYAS